jgi:hypothetical protein
VKPTVGPKNTSPHLPIQPGVLIHFSLDIQVRRQKHRHSDSGTPRFPAHFPFFPTSRIASNNSPKPSLLDFQSPARSSPPWPPPAPPPTRAPCGPPPCGRHSTSSPRSCQTTTTTATTIGRSRSSSTRHWRTTSPALRVRRSIGSPLVDSLGFWSRSHAGFGPSVFSVGFYLW